MRFLLTSSRLQIGAGVITMAALALAQLVIILLHYWPSSVALWVLYFGYAQRLDSIYRVLHAAVPIDAVGFIALLVLAGAVAGVAMRARIRLLEALVFHAMLGCAVLVLLDNFGLWPRPGIGTDFGSSPGLFTVVVLFAPSAVALAAACWRTHRRYVATVRKQFGRRMAVR